MIIRFVKDDGTATPAVWWPFVTVRPGVIEVSDGEGGHDLATLDPAPAPSISAAPEDRWLARNGESFAKVEIFQDDVPRALVADLAIEIPTDVAIEAGRL